jgi:glycosyltransferase involved in cell wall biosynthesis
MSLKNKLLRITTVPMSLNFLLKGQMLFMNQHFETLGVSSGPTDELETVAKREGVEVCQVKMSRTIKPIRDLMSLWELYWLFREEKPVIIHSMTPKAGLLSMIAAYLVGVPIRIHTFTGLIFPYKTGLLQKILIAMDKLLCSCATHIYPEGQGVRNDLMNYKITNKPLNIIANGNVNGIDTQFFSPNQISEEEKNTLKSELGFKASDFVFVFVGRLVGDKGINELVKAFSVMSEQLLSTKLNSRLTTHDSRLLLVGPFESELDPLQPETLQEIKDNSNIIAVGFQEDVRPYFAISDALAFPSYREGFPNVVMQAGAMGLPSIVSNINGCNEIIEDGKNGLIIPPKDTAALQQAMLKLINDSALYQHLKTNSRPIITSRYEQQVVWEALLEEYKELLKMKGLGLEKDPDPETSSG